MWSNIASTAYFIYAILQLFVGYFECLTKMADDLFERNLHILDGRLEDVYEEGLEDAQSKWMLSEIISNFIGFIAGLNQVE